MFETVGNMFKFVAYMYVEQMAQYTKNRKPKKKKIR